MANLSNILDIFKELIFDHLPKKPRKLVMSHDIKYFYLYFGLYQTSKNFEICNMIFEAFSLLKTKACLASIAELIDYYKAKIHHGRKITEAKLQSYSIKY